MVSEEGRKRIIADLRSLWSDLLNLYCTHRYPVSVFESLCLRITSHASYKQFLRSISECSGHLRRYLNHPFQEFSRPKIGILVP